MKLVKSPIYLCLFMIGLSACGGGGGSSESSKIDTQLSGPKQGFITIEERSNKRVVDAWFSQGELPEQQASVLWEEGSNRCALLEQPSYSANDSALSIGTRWRDTLFAGDFISIDSRAGEISRLIAQRLDTAVLYASEERWIAEPLPDDTQIVVTGSDEFPAFDAVSVAPLTRLVRTAPENGVTWDLTSPIQWEASSSTDDVIELTVAASENTEQSASTVKCWLDDAGQFVLPDVVRQALPANRQSVVSLVRARSATYNSGDALLHVSQTSYP